MKLKLPNFDGQNISQCQGEGLGIYQVQSLEQ